MTDLTAELHRLAKNAPERCKYIEPGSPDYHPYGDDVFVVLLNNDAPFDELDPLFWADISGRHPHARDLGQLLMALLQEIEARRWRWAQWGSYVQVWTAEDMTGRDYGAHMTARTSAGFVHALARAFNDACEAGGDEG